MTLRRLTATVVLVTAVGAVPARGAVPERAFTAEASASPLEVIAGRNETDVGSRFFATRSAATNPPPNGYGRAALVDLGFAESLRGPQGPNAEADTGVPNLGDDAVVDDGASRYEAHVDRTPSSRTSAQGGTWSSDGIAADALGSSSTAGVADGAIVATVHATVSGLRVDALAVTGARFAAEARTSGEPGGAHAEGSIELVGATFAGTPVVIGPSGVHVDDTQVPAAQLAAATAALGDALSGSPFAELRLVQPVVEVADDGTRATVRGGGLFVRLTNATPGDSYFAEYRLVGGEIAVFVGAPLDAGAVAGDEGDGPPVAGGSPTRVPGVPIGSGASTGEPPGGVVGPAVDAGYRLVTDQRAPSLASPWAGLPVALGVLWGAAVVAAVVWWLPAAAGVRRRLAEHSGRFATRYLRG